MKKKLDRTEFLVGTRWNGEILIYLVKDKIRIFFKIVETWSQNFGLAPRLNQLATHLKSKLNRQDSIGKKLTPQACVGRLSNK
jgi:hypothetical protein